jgi:hypothetical protein
LDKEQIGPAGKGSSDNGFVFWRIAAALLSGLFFVMRSYQMLNGIRASADVRLAPGRQ